MKFREIVKRLTGFCFPVSGISCTMRWIDSKLATICLIFISLTFIGTNPLSGQTILVNSGVVWKYLDDGSDQNTSWRYPSFNDAGWATGAAKLGYGDGDEATVISYGSNPNNKHITYYFRHSFNVTDPSQYLGLTLGLLCGDGAVVYLNGIEIERSNMPSGTIDYLTLASSTVGGGDEEIFFESLENPGNLITGTNVLAVEVHLISATSSDVSFDLRLEGPNITRKAPYLIYNGNNTEMQVHWQLYSTAVSTLEWGTTMQYSLGSVLTNEYGDDHQHTYTITNLTPGTKYYYRVTVDQEIHTGSFWSAPYSNDTSIKFFVYGDTRSYPTDHDQVAADMVATYLGDENFHTLILSAGDLVNNGDRESDWDSQFFGPSYTNIQEMLTTLPYQSCMGNHEGNGVLFTKYFPYPFVAGRYWSFDYGIAHFVVIDQYTDYDPGSDQLVWIENDLASRPNSWNFIILHEPGWSAGSWHDNNIDVQNYIQPLCEQYNVHVVFAGHNHYYARALVNNVHHITTGGGGAPLYDPEPDYPNIVTSTKAHHFCKVEIDGTQLIITVVDTSGNIIDSFTTEDLALPVELSHFAAYQEVNFIILEWITESEVNNVGFNIYRSQNYSNNYQKINKVLIEGAGSSTSRHEYEYTDFSAINGVINYYKLEDVDINGKRTLHRPISVNHNISLRNNIPSRFYLYPNFPNPFNHYTKIHYDLSEDNMVDLTIYDIRGEKVLTVVKRFQNAGSYKIVWRGTNMKGNKVSSGIYFVRLRTDKYTNVIKMIFIQ